MLNPNTPIKPPIRNVKYFGEVLKYVWGWKGTGKTTMLKWFKQKITSMEVQVIYLNCRLYPTPVSLLNEVLKQLKELYPDHVSTESDTRPEIVDYIKHIKNKQVFLLLDEIDKPLRNSKTSQPDEFLHYLVRLVSENTANLFKVVFATNVVNIERFLSDEVLSFLGGNKIYFCVYTVEEMVEILDKRAKKALYPNTYEIKDLQMIAHIAHGTYDGDIRTALNLLKRVAKKSDKKINMELLSKSQNEMNFDLLKKEVVTFPKGVQILLASLLDHIDKKPKVELGYIHFQTSDLYNIYKEFCKREMYSSTQRAMFYRYLGMLVDSMILIKQTKGYKLSEDIKHLKACIKTVV
jgi:Cdc6-like AAA superfamily ATPase